MTRAVAEAIFTYDPADTTSALDAQRILQFSTPHGPIGRRWSEHADDIVAMVSSVRHFALPQGTRTAPFEVPHREDPDWRPCSYLDVLSEAVNDDLVDPDREYVHTTLEYIDKLGLPREGREIHMRSTIVEPLLHATRTQELQTVVHTVVGAWNCAVQRTLASHGGGSVGSLPRGAWIAQYVDLPGDALFDVSAVTPEDDLLWGLRERATKVPWDPMKLTWAQVKTISADTKKTRSAYQQARQSGDVSAVVAAFNEHLIALCKHKLLVPQPPGPWNLLWVLGAPLGAFATSVFFGSDWYQGAITGGAPAVFQLVRAARLARKRVMFMNTLTGLAPKEEEST